jgi:hypothetical protein
MIKAVSLSSLFKISLSLFFSLILTACGGGGGSGGGNATDNTPTLLDIYNPENYTKNNLNDSSLNGIWMLVEKTTLEFDLSYISSLTGFFTLDYSRRTTVNINELDVPAQAPPLPVQLPDLAFIHCMDNSLLSVENADLLGGTIALQIEGFTFEGSIINNNRIEGRLIGSDGDGANVINSQITLVKIFDPSSPEIQPQSLSSNTIDISIQSDQIQDKPPLCFEETEFSGKSYIDNELVDISGHSLFIATLYDADNSGITFIDEGADILLLDLNIDDINFKSLETNTPTAMFLQDENASFNINSGSLSILSGSASGTDNFGQTANVNFYFNFNP